MPPATSTAYELGRCAVCGGAEVDELADAEAVRRQIEDLWAFHLRRLRPDTPPEALTDRVAFSQRPPLRVVRCRRCGLVYRNPRERDFEVSEAYARAALDPAVLDALYETQRASYAGQARRLTRVLGRPGRGLEVGSYVGGFLAAAADLGWTFEGLDVAGDAVAWSRRRGHRVHHGDLASLAGSDPVEPPARRYDAVAIWNTFDQLPDPRADAARASRLLAPGGILAVRVPNGAFYAALAPRLAGPLGPLARTLLAHSNLLGFPYRHGFTVRSLAMLFESVGLRIADVHGDALVPIGDRHTRRWAATEERVVKWALRRSARAGLGRAGRLAAAARAPWIEVFARV